MMRIKDLFPDASGSGRVLVLGELLLDFVPCDSDMRLFQPGAVLKTVSGSSGIYACASAGFGLDCSFIGKVGTDPFSQLALSSIAGQGVRTDAVIHADRGQLGLAFLEYLPSGRNYAYYRDGSVGSQLRPEELSETVFHGASLLHLPGMLLELNEGMRQSCFRAVELAKQNHALFSFDPNLRKELHDNAQMRHGMMQMISMADIIEPTLEEARTITGRTAISDVLHALHDAGPRLVVLTCDKDGAIFSFDGQILYAEGIDVPVVDPTGAGDTFAAALACCIKENMRMDDAIAFCNCAGTLVCMKRGAIGMAIPTRDQVLEMMRTHPARLHLQSMDEWYEKEHQHGTA